MIKTFLLFLPEYRVNLPCIQVNYLVHLMLHLLQFLTPELCNLPLSLNILVSVILFIWCIYNTILFLITLDLLYLAFVRIICLPHTLNPHTLKCIILIYLLHLHVLGSLACINNIILASGNYRIH